MHKKLLRKIAKIKAFSIKNSKWIIIGIVSLLFIGGISFKQILDRTVKKRSMKIEYLVIHYTANASAAANAEMNARYLRNKEQAGTHYCIDDQEIIQCTDENNVAYAVGDRKWLGFIPKPWLKNKIKNNNSLSFEMCLGGGRNDSMIVEKTAQIIGWQLINKGFLRTDSTWIWDDSLNKQVLFTKKVPDLGRVVRHHDVSGKHCPKFYYKDPVWNQAKEDRAFYIFKQKCLKYANIHLEAKNKTKTQIIQ